MSSLNVQGLGDNTKRREVFKYFKDLNKDIIFVQESHCTSEKEKLWSSEWGRKIWCAHGTSAARGVMVLLKRNLPLEVVECNQLFDGRVIMLTVKIDEALYVLVNVYGPNEDNPHFYVQLFEEIEKLDVVDLLIVGDLNATLNYKLDTRGCTSDSHSKKREIINSYMDLQEMSDIWRDRNPDKYQFSSKRNDDKRITSRLDYFLISKGLINRVTKTDINPGFRSDHCRVDLNLDLSSSKRGKGVWRFNNLLLHDKEFVSQMNVLIDQYNWGVKTNITPAQEWEFLKLEITTLASEFARNRAKGKSQLIEMLENKIKKLDEKLLELDDCDQRNLIKKSVKRTREFLENEYAEKAAKAIFRSKSKYYNEGEKNSKYFFNLERRNFEAKVIKSLKTKDENIIRDPKSILRAQARHFKNLYSHDESQDRPLPFHNHTEHKLNDEDALATNAEISLDEISNALMQLENSKTPGIDGLPVEFYKFFWNRLKLVVFRALRFALETGTLHRSARRGLITLIPKKEKDLQWLDNWRPITLLNTDYKILSKTLALRMKNKLPFLINEDQSGFMQDRNISHNIRKIIDIIQIAEQRKLQAILISIDFYKCFDSLTFKGIDGALKFFNFGTEFRRYVQILLKGTQSCTMNNGYISDWFYQNKGTKQGCCISAFLAVCCLEVFAHQIRNNDKIKGITINDVEYKLIQFADDLNLPLLFDHETLYEVENTLDSFEMTMGLKVNYNKTSIYRIGSLKDSNARIYTGKPFHWTNNAIKILGINIDHDFIAAQRVNLYSILDKANNVCKLWAHRQLSLIGKVTVINSLIGSLFVYKLSALDLLTQKRIKSIEAGIKKFLWNGKRPKMKLETLCKDRESGGLRLVDINKKDIALKAQWVFTYKEYPKIRNLANYFIPEMGQDWWLANLKKDDIHKIMPQNSYWKQVSIAWAHTNFHVPQNIVQVAKQFLWFNSHIRIGKKPVWYQNAWRANVRYVADIVNNDGSILSFEQFKAKFGNCLNFVQYFGLVKALPADWITLLKTEIGPDPNEINFQLQFNTITKKTAKELYSKSIKDNQICKNLQVVWAQKLEKLEDRRPSVVEIESCFLNLKFVTPSIKYRSFQYRLLHRRIFLNNILYKWKIVDSPLCEYCRSDYETIEHFFVECPVVKRFWTLFQSWFECLTDTEITLSPRRILFNNFENIHGAELLNAAILHAKQYLFSQKCLDREYGFYTFKEKLFEIIKYERIVAYQKNKRKKFCKKWGPLLK